MAAKPQYLWSESFALQIPTIDAQHKTLFDMIYELECSFEAGKEGLAAGVTVSKLKAYCQHHFGTEEQLMQECGYPGLHAHLMKHDDFTRTVLEFEEEREAGSGKIALQIATFLKQWLANHIAVEDRKIVPFVRPGTPELGAAAPGVPVLIEVESAELQQDMAVCARVAEHLAMQGVPRVELVHSLEQARSTLKVLGAFGQAPALFVINTFGARGLLAELDALMGELPVLYLRRALYSGVSGLLDQVTQSGHADSAAAISVMAKMTPRLTSMWFYGPKNSAVVAQRAAEAVLAYLKAGDFRCIERAKPANW